jgi:hypothetical protein
VADYQNRAREMMSAAHEQLYRQYQRERGIRFFFKSNINLVVHYFNEIFYKVIVFRQE